MPILTGVTASTVQDYAITRVLSSPMTIDWVHFPKHPNGQIKPTETVVLGYSTSGDKIFNAKWNTGFVFKALTQLQFDTLTALFDADNQTVLLNRPCMSVGPTPGTLSWIYSLAKLSDLILWSSPEDTTGSTIKNVTLLFTSVIDYIRGVPNMPF